MSIKWIGYVVGAIMILNLILFAAGIVGQAIFWVIIVLGAVFTYFILPKIKK